MPDAPVVVASLEWLGPALTAAALVVTSVGSLIGSLVAAWIALKARDAAKEATVQAFHTHEVITEAAAILTAAPPEK